MDSTYSQLSLSRFFCLFFRIVTFTDTGECFPKPKTFWQRIYDYLYGVDDVPKQFYVEELWNEILVALSIRSPVVPEPTPFLAIIKGFDGLFPQINLTFLVVMVTFLMLTYICVRRIDWWTECDDDEEMDNFYDGLDFDMKGLPDFEATNDITSCPDHANQDNQEATQSVCWKLIQFITFLVLNVMVAIAGILLWLLPTQCSIGGDNSSPANKMRKRICSRHAKARRRVGKKNKSKRLRGKTTSTKASLRSTAVDGCSAVDSLANGRAWEDKSFLVKEKTTPEDTVKEQASRSEAKCKKNRKRRGFRTARPKITKRTKARKDEDKQLDSLISTLSKVMVDLQLANKELDVVDNSDTWSVDLSVLSFEAHEDRIKTEMLEMGVEYDWDNFDEDLKTPSERRLRDTMWDISDSVESLSSMESSSVSQVETIQKHFICGESCLLGPPGYTCDQIPPSTNESTKEFDI